LIELPVNAALREHCCVPLSRKLALMHYQNAVGALDGREAVRNHHTRGSFIQNQVFRIVRQRAGEADQLFLPGGKSAAAFAD
jgi:hypothetical protein